MNITYSNYVSSLAVSAAPRQNERSTGIEALSRPSVGRSSLIDLICQGDRHGLRPFPNHVSTSLTFSSHGLQPHFKESLKLQPSFTVYRHLIFFYQLLKNRSNMKLVLFAMRRAHSIRARLALISFCSRGLQPSSLFEQPLLHSTSSLSSCPHGPLRGPLDHCLSLIRSVYWMKCKSDANLIRHQKNLLYVKIKAFHCILLSDSATRPHLIPSSSLPDLVSYTAPSGPSFIKLITLNA